MSAQTHQQLGARLSLPSASVLSAIPRDGNPSCAEVPMWDGHPFALTGGLEAGQAELTVLPCSEDDGTLRATAYRFCASREGLEPTGAFAFVPA